MIIVSQDNNKHYIPKRIINFDNINYIQIDRPGENDWVLIFKDNTMKEDKLSEYNCLLGVYSTEERAKEVLQEIAKKYEATIERLGKKYITLEKYGFIYELPKN